MKTIRPFVLVVLTLSVVGIFGMPVNAEEAPDPEQVAERQKLCEVNDAPGAQFFGLPTWYKYLDREYNFQTGSCDVKFPIKTDGSGDRDFPKVATAILLAVFEILMRIGTLVAIGFVIYGGFMFITSNGQPDRAKAARGTVLNAVIGLVITLVAVGLVNLIGNVLTG